MLNSLIQHLNCEACGHELVYDPKITFDSYYSELKFAIENVESKVKEMVGLFLIYECSKCKCTYKYTYKEIEKMIRRETTKQVLLAVARGQMKNMQYINACSNVNTNIGIFQVITLIFLTITLSNFLLILSTKLCSFFRRLTAFISHKLATFITPSLKSLIWNLPSIFLSNTSSK